MNIMVVGSLYLKYCLGLVSESHEIKSLGLCGRLVSKIEEMGKVTFRILI